MILKQIDTNILELEKKSEIELKEIYDKIDRICMINSSRILSAFIENKVSYSDFADINGYGNYDPGRDKLEKIFAKVLGMEDALVRPQIMSGTNALFLTFSSLLKHGDTFISLTGTPYDSLQEMIGLVGNSTQSLKASGVKYDWESYWPVNKLGTMGFKVAAIKLKNDGGGFNINDGRLNFIGAKYKEEQPIKIYKFSEVILWLRETLLS